MFALQGNVTESKHWGMRALISTSTDSTGQLIGFIELLFLYLEKGVPHFSSNLTTVILTVALGAPAWHILALDKHASMNE